MRVDTTSFGSSKLLRTFKNDMLIHATFKGIVQLYLNEKLKETKSKVRVFIMPDDTYKTVDDLDFKTFSHIKDLIIYIEKNIFQYVNDFNKNIGYTESTARKLIEVKGKFTHLVFHNDLLYNKYVSYFDDFDFKSVKRCGGINLLHFTPKSNVESIMTRGFEHQDWVGDLGQGIYCIRQGHAQSLHNVTRYFMSFEEEQEGYINSLCAFRMYYDGNYIECISGYLHEGYIVAHQGAGRLHTQVIEEASKYLNYDNLQFDLYD